VKYLFKKSFIYSANDRWQRSIWNCVHYYPERNICKENVLYTDDYISNILMRFRLHVFNKYNIRTDRDKYERVDVENKKDLIIIERKHNKKISSSLLDSIVQEAQKNIQWIYNGIAVLEDMSFSEQIQLFNKNRILIMRHGSSLINLLWCKPGAIVFELEGGSEGTGHPVVTKRLCDLIGLTFNPLNYDTFNPTSDIFDHLL
jgi:capsular polysaccharide biosynthesis protein